MLHQLNTKRESNIHSVDRIQPVSKSLLFKVIISPPSFSFFFLLRYSSSLWTCGRFMGSSHVIAVEFGAISFLLTCSMGHYFVFKAIKKSKILNQWRKVFSWYKQKNIKTWPIVIKFVRSVDILSNQENVCPCTCNFNWTNINPSWQVAYHMDLL